MNENLILDFDARGIFSQHAQCSHVMYINNPIVDVQSMYINNPIINNLETPKDLSEDYVHEHNYQKSLMVECYEQTWFHNGLILKTNIFYKFSYEYETLVTMVNADHLTGKEISNNEEKDKELVFQNFYER